jgi:hypothetical protein
MHINRLIIVQWTSFVFLAIYVLLNFYLISYDTHEFYQWFGKAICLPDNCFCEKIHINQIAQPINSFTNIFYVYVGIIILFRLKKWDLFTILYAYIVILLGLSSFFYHATMTFFGMWLDVFSMYMYILFLIFYLIYYADILDQKKGILFYMILLFVSGIFLYQSPLFRRILFGFYVILTLFVFYRIKNKIFINPKNFYIALAIFIISYAIWLLDYYRILCNPESWIQGHGIWHTLNSMVIYYLYLFFWELRISKNSNSKELT